MFGLRGRLEQLRESSRKSGTGRSNRSPFKVNPKVGFYPPRGDSNEAFPCTLCAVDVEVKHVNVTFNLRMQFNVMYDSFDFFFPISECGNVADFKCSVQGLAVRGELVRDLNGKLLGPNDEGFDEPGAESNPLAAAAVAAEGKAASPKPAPKPAAGSSKGAHKPDNPPPPVYYYYVRLISSQLEKHLAIKRGTKLDVRLTVKTEGFIKGAVCNIPFPLSTLPRTPDEFKYVIEMNESIRRIASPNKSHPVFPYINGKKADLTVPITAENRMRLEDYMYVLQIELGEPIVPQCADPVTLFILVTTVAAMVFFTLTRDLEDY